jgi:hypothetical protein
MSEDVFLALGFIIFAILLGFIVYLIVQKMKNVEGLQRINYKTFFILGACFLPASIAISLSSDNNTFSVLSILGLIYLVIGLANRDQWE